MLEDFIEIPPIPLAATTTAEAFAEAALIAGEADCALVRLADGRFAVLIDGG